MFQVTVSQSNGRPEWMTVRSQEFITRQEAEAVAAIFPKSAKIGVCSVSRGAARGGDYYQVGMAVKFIPTKGNDKNEGGIKRYRTFRAKAAAAGYAVEFPVHTHNPDQWMTEEALEAAIG